MLTIKDVREKRGWTQELAAEKCHVSKRTLSRF